MKSSRKIPKFIVLFFMILLLLSMSGCSQKSSEAAATKTPSYPIASKVVTTEQRTIVPTPIPSGSAILLPYEISKYSKNGYGKWSYGPGLATVKRLDLMPADYTGKSVTGSAALLHFFTMSDIHITDEETPAEAVEFGYKGGNSSAYSPVIMLTTQVLDAAVQTANALNKKNPFDFGLFLGDAINNTQYNELRWYIDVIDGKKIIPDSGIKDDPVPGPLNDYQDEYQAAGLDPSIKWYQVLGNHDQYHMGAAPVTDYLRKTYIGTDILNLGNIMTDPLFTDSRGIYMGSVDGSTPYGDIYGAGPANEFTAVPQVPAADPDRRSLTKNEWMSEFFKTTSKPKGHGFTKANLDKNFACYSFEPKSDLPLKVVVFDDNQTDASFDIKEQGSVDRERFDWLVSELDTAQTEGKLVIVSSHIPLYMIGLQGNSPVSQKELITKLNTYPNLVMWLSGHYHQNTVTAYKSPDPKHPELGFWLVETASLRDFPQEFRTFDLVRNSDNTLSIFADDVDMAFKKGSLAARSHSYSIAAEEMFKNYLNYSPVGAYNAELVKQLSPEMQQKLADSGTKINN